ncbi:MAG TPA: hypothetical protein VID76_10240 [Solirubrobacterales bacterium]|jgi:hypothetical protein
MAEIRFPKLGRGARRGGHAAHVDDPLARMRAQIQALDEAATAAAVEIAAAAENLDRGGEAAIRADLLAGLASALVDRTETIRADCRRLSAMMERTARLVADGDSAAGVGGPEVRDDAAATDDEDPDEDLPSTDAESGAPREPTESAVDPGTRDHDQEPAARAGATDPGARWLTTRSGASAPAASVASDGVRLIATQMALAGSSRLEIERRLRIQFGVDDADRALDDIFGHRHSEVG